MRILIDGRMYGLEYAGIGRYVVNLVEALAEIDKKNHYSIFLRKKYFAELNLSQNWKGVLVDIPHYSLEEQVRLPIFLKKEKPDLVHFPHFDIPVFYTGKFIVTIHDLIKHTSKGAETTTKQPWFYWLKYLGYKLIFGQAVKRAAKILVPSKSVKEELRSRHNLSEGKIVVTYEGVDKNYQLSVIPSTKFRASNYQLSKRILQKYSIQKPFIIYTGSLYPHKNVDRLVKAIVNLNDLYHLNISLVVVCARGVFYERFKQRIKEMKAENFINLVGFIPDKDLVLLYKEAVAFVFPTLSEGFGLPGLEAMAAGCPVICSDIPVLREIYGEAAIYFDPFNVNDIAKKIRDICYYEQIDRNKIIEKGLEQVTKYSWQKMAEQTLSAYKEALR